MTQAFIVFDAYGGIGSQLCRRLSSHGAKLVMAGRDEVHLAALASELGEKLSPSTRPIRIKWSYA